MKWRQFLPVWLAVFLLAPSIWVHRIFMLATPPPGGPDESLPFLIPFGGVHFGSQFCEQLLRGDLGDSMVIFLALVLPILVYTFLLSGIIYYVFQRIRRSRRP